MLLGQIVAISFASNMFFLAVLVHDQVVPAGAGKGSKRPESLAARISSAAFWYDPIVIFTIGLAVNVPSTFGQPNFMPLLLTPHILAFAPLLLNRLLPQVAPAHTLDNKPSLITQVTSIAVIVGWATFSVVDQGGDWSIILRTLHEHPAVSSVGWDVICCWVSYTAWHLFGEA